MRGPSWNYDENSHSYGANTTDVALVINHVNLKTEKLFVGQMENTFTTDGIVMVCLMFRFIIDAYTSDHSNNY